MLSHGVRLRNALVWCRGCVRSVMLSLLLKVAVNGAGGQVDNSSIQANESRPRCAQKRTGYLILNLTASGVVVMKCCVVPCSQHSSNKHIAPKHIRLAARAQDCNQAASSCSAAKNESSTEAADQRVDRNLASARLSTSMPYPRTRSRESAEA